MLKAFRSRLASLFSPIDDGNLICAGMVRNEIDIIDVWVSHLTALFDRVIIYDHLSTDGTRQRLHEIAKADPRIEVREFDEPAQNQSRTMTETLREVSRKDKSGWLFFLDADEFIIVSDRKEFMSKLDMHRASASVILTWANAHPVPLASRIGGDSQVEGWATVPRRIQKCAVNLRYAGLVDRIEEGNHSVRFARAPTIRNIILFRLLHLPIRSERQISKKIIEGVSKYDIVDPDGKRGWGIHYREMVDADVIGQLDYHTYHYGGRLPETASAPPSKNLVGRLADLVPLSTPS